MEDAHRTHKEVPIGWVQWLIQVGQALQRRRYPSPPWCDLPAATPPDDLHHLSAPH